MPAYMVKDKYTYERVRQTDYRFSPNTRSLSGNLITGRFLYEAGEPIAELSLTGGETVSLDLPLSVKTGFSGVAGFRLSVRSVTPAESADPADSVVRVTLWGENGESFLSVCPAAVGDWNFSCMPMDFVPVRLTADVSEGTLTMTGTIRPVWVLDTLGELGGQSHFYRAEQAGLTDRKGEMILTCSGSGAPRLESPVFPDTQKTVYNMKMPRRNTIFLVLKNATSAKRAVLSFTTYEHPAFSADASVTFDLPEGCPETAVACYVNLSRSPLCSGRLKQFRLDLPEGTSGNLTVVRYTFEQEKPLRDIGAHILSCKADPATDTVTVCGELTGTKPLSDMAGNGGMLTVYATTMASETDTPAGKRRIGQIPLPEGGCGSFCIGDIPFRDECTTLLPYQLALFAECGTESLWLCDRFYIENYEDFDANPYPFDLPDYTVSVLDFGACGDAVHDDTEAIQKALDHVSANGGGTVLLPGSDDFYGRRYIVTNLLIPSMTELHFGDGAVLWQSQLREDYPYRVSYGHDGVIPGINWTHCLHVDNLPLLQAHNAHHIKITGHGALRMMDTGSEEGVDMPGYASGCPDRIHLIPIGFFRIHHCECRDFEILRSNNYHTDFKHSRWLYCANLRLHEVKCVSGDGFGIPDTHHVLINRCFFQSNDDGVTLSTHYHDPRGILWWTNCPDDNTVRDVTVVHSYLNSGGGKAIAFIPWGTSDPDQSREEISEIHVTDNYLVSVNPVGTWCDNPYNGKQPFDNSETDDYSPIKDVRIFKNRYVGNCTLLSVQATNVITDCGIHSTGQFRNGDFTLGGMANWTLFPNDHPDSVHSVLYADKTKGCIEHFDAGDVAAAQGLHLSTGTHRVTMELMTGQDGAELFASVIETGELLARTSAVCIRPATVELSFTISDDGDPNRCRDAEDVFIGVRSVGKNPDGFALFDHCHIESHTDEEALIRRRTEHFMAGLRETFALDGSECPRDENGKSVLGVEAGEEVRLMTTARAFRTFTAEAAVRVEDYNRERGQNGFGYRFSIRDGGASYRELRFFESSRLLRLTDVQNGTETVLYERENFFFTSLDFHIFRLEMNPSSVNIWIDGAEYAVIPLEPMEGKVAFLFCDSRLTLSNPSVSSDT